MENKALYVTKAMIPLLTAVFGAGMMALHYYSVSTEYDPGILYKADDRFLLLLLSTAVTGAIFGNKMNRPWEKGANLVLIAFFTLMIIMKSLQSMGSWGGFVGFFIAIPLGLILLIIISLTRFREDKEEGTVGEDNVEPMSETTKDPKTFNAFAVTVKTLAILVCVFPFAYFLLVIFTLP